MEKYKRLAKDTLVFAIGNLGSKLLLFLLVPLYTNYLTTGEYGTVELIGTAANLLVPVTSLVIFDAVLRFGLEKKNPGGAVLKSAGLVFLLGSLFTVTMTPFLSFVQSLAEWKWFVALYVITYMGDTIIMTYLKTRDKSKMYALLGLVETLSLAVLNLVLLAGFHMTIYGYLIANIASRIITSVLAFIASGAMRDLKRDKFDKTLCRNMVVYSTPLIANNISWWVVQSSDKLMVQFFLDSAAVGLYSVAAKIPALINVITAIFSQAWGISSIREYDSDKDTGFYEKIFSLYSFAVFFICACILVIIKPFMHIYVGKEFTSAWVFVPWLLAAAAFSAISAFFGSVYGAMKRSINVTISTVLSASINIGLNMVLIPRIGVMGAAIATAVSYVFIALYRMYDTGRYFSFPIHKKKLFTEYISVCLATYFVTIDHYGMMAAMAAAVLILVINTKNIRQIADLIKKRRK